MFLIIIDLFQSIIGAFASGKIIEQYKKDKEQDKKKE